MPSRCSARGRRSHGDLALLFRPLAGCRGGGARLVLLVCGQRHLSALRRTARSRGRGPRDLLLVETDAPFLAPQPQRGKPNAPEYVVATAAAVAEARGTEYEQLERCVEANAERALGW